MTEQTQDKINTKALIKLTAEHTDYLLYEVQDVLKGFSDVLQEQLQKGNAVKLAGVGTFYPKVNSPKNYKLPSGCVYVSEGSMGVRFQPDTFLNRAVNEGFQGE